MKRSRNRTSINEEKTKKFCTCIQPSFLFLSEAKNSSSKVQNKLLLVGFLKCEFVENNVSKGGLVFAWESNFKYQTIFKSKFAIRMKWSLPKNNNTYLIGEYLFTNVNVRGH